MPPFEYGLLKEPTELKVKALPNYSRYKLYLENPKDENYCVFARK